MDGKIILFICTLLFFGCYKVEDKTFKPINKIEIRSTYTDVQKKLLELHNNQRSFKKISSLVLDEKLCDYAQNHAEIMARKNSLYHSSMSDLSLLDDASTLVGENIAWGQETEEDVVNAWMWSPGHRWNILSSNFSKVGFGLEVDKNGRLYWCTVFSN
jgi:uncharacterized protein YkwD